MSNDLPPGSLHPNIARIAAAYDQIIEQMGNRQLTATEARAQIEQLEARDDQGIRWSIDPDSGRFIRTTMTGDTHYDTPPMYGFQTDDAYSYSTTRGSEFDPNMRVEMFAAQDQRLTQAPVDLSGATRNGPGGAHHGAMSSLSKIPVAYRVAAALILAILLIALIAG